MVVLFQVIIIRGVVSCSFLYVVETLLVKSNFFLVKKKKIINYRIREKERRSNMIKSKLSVRVKSRLSAILIFKMKILI